MMSPEIAVKKVTTELLADVPQPEPNQGCDTTGSPPPEGATRGNATRYTGICIYLQKKVYAWCMLTGTNNSYVFGFCSVKLFLAQFCSIQLSTLLRSTSFRLEAHISKQQAQMHKSPSARAAILNGMTHLIPVQLQFQMFLKNMITAPEPASCPHKYCGC